MATPTYELISQTTTSSATNSISVTSIPSTYRDLVVTFDFIKDVLGADSLNFRINNDSSSIYYGVIMEADGSTTNSRSYGPTGDAVISWDYSLVQGTARTLVVLNLLDYSATDKHKTILGRGNNSGAAVDAAAVRAATTSAVSSVQFFTGGGSSFKSGATVSIYGIAS